MLERGVFLPPSAFEAWFLSLAHGDAEMAAILRGGPWRTCGCCRGGGPVTAERAPAAGTTASCAPAAAKPIDATPVWFMRQAGRSLPEYRRIRETATLEQIVGDAALCAEVTLQPVRRLGVDAAILFADITTPLRGHRRRRSSSWTASVR